MGVLPVSFAGQNFYTPGAYSTRNFVSNQGGGVSRGNILILGYSELGEPQKLLVFNSSNDAIRELGSGEGVDGVIQAFEPGNDLTPQQVGFMRVNPGTQSTRILVKSATSIFSVKSFSWGVPMNQIRLKFSAGTTVGTHKIETDYKGESLSQDNIERKSLTVHYTGAGTACALNVTETKLTTTVTGAASDDLDITLSAYPTISELAQFINNQTNYTATVLAENILDSSIVLDYVTNGDALTSPITLKSDHEAIYEALQLNAQLADIKKEGTDRTVPDVDTDFIYLTGATSGTYTTQDFTDSLEIAEKEDIQLISTTSTTAAIHQLIKNHCVKMSSITGRKERQCYVGGAINESESDVIARAKALGSATTCICYPGYYQFKNGKEYLYSPAYLACKQVGLVSALPLNTPTTFKTSNVLRWEKDFSSYDSLIQGGVLVGGKDSDGNYVTVRAITTTPSTTLQEVEASVVRETFFQDADLRKRMERGLVGTPGVGGAQLTKVDTIFERAISDWLQEGHIAAVGGQTYQGYTRSLNGDVITIEYGTWNVVGTNFVFITHNVLVPTA